MTLDEIRAFVEKQQGGKPYLEALNAYIEAQVNASKKDKDSIKKLSDELKESKEKVGTISAKLEKFSDALGVSEDSETLDEDIENALKSKGDKADPTLQRKIERLTKQLNETKQTMTEQLNAERGKRHEAMIRNALLSELTAQKALDPEALIDIFASKVKVAEDDSMTLGADGKAVKDGISEYLKAHPSLVSNKQNPGAGGAGGGGGDSGDKFIDLAKSLGKSASKPKEDPADNYFK